MDGFFSEKDQIVISGQRGKSESKGRVVYADALRCVAALAVVLLHSSADYMHEPPFTDSLWYIANAFNSLSRWCVPVFVMLSGAFMLNPRKALTIQGVWRKNIAKLVVAFIIWSLLYSVYDVAVSGWGGIPAFLSSVIQGEYHLWYIPMLIMLYMLTPVMRVVVPNRTLLLYITALSLVFPMLVAYVGLLPQSMRQSFSSLLSDTSVGFGYVGYFFLGYVLFNVPFKKKHRAAIYVIGILGAIVTIAGMCEMNSHAEQLNRLFYGNGTINVAAMSIAVFVLFRYSNVLSNEQDLELGVRKKVIKAIEKVSSAGLGVYLIHVFFLKLSRQVVETYITNCPILILFWAVAVFAVSCCAALTLKRIPIVSRWLV